MPKSWHEVRRGNTLGSQVVRLQDALAAKAAYANRLEGLLRSRSAQIDELNGKVEQLRAANARLDAEAERYAKMVGLSPDQF
jgi:uncharacterized protein HemX